MADSPVRKPRSAGEMREVHKRWLERRAVRFAAAIDGVERFVVLGTVAGTVGSLAVAVAVIATGRLIDLEFYLALVAFLIGLFLVWIGRYLDVILAVDIRRASAAWIPTYYVRRSVFWLSAMCVVLGTVLCLVELYTFTR